MNNSSELLNKLKEKLLSTNGKIMMLVFGFASSITFFLTISNNNTLSFSFFRALSSGLIACFILYIVYLILSLILGKEMVNFDNNVNTTSQNNSPYIDNLESEIDVDAQNIYNRMQESSKAKENEFDYIGKSDISDDIGDLLLDSTKKEDSPSVDINSDLSYHNESSNEDSKSDDIGSIISNNADSNSKSITDDFFIDFSAPVDADPITMIAKSDPETAAKAIRTIRSKDDK